jgi:hypothetical protein
LSSAGLRRSLGDLPPVIVAAGYAQVMRTLQLTAVRALGVGGRL